MDPTLVKFIHILSAILLFGTGLGTAFHGLVGNRTQHVAAIAQCNRAVVLADWIFTTPAVIIQPISGLWLAHVEGWPLESAWIILTLTLYGVAGACWLPVVWLQLRMRRLADEALLLGTPLPARYHRYAKLWFALGWPAFAAMIAILALMVFKPDW